MFSHIMLGAKDIDASKKFYDAVLGIGVEDEESTNDTRSISERFRTSIR